MRIGRSDRLPFAILLGIAFVRTAGVARNRIGPAVQRVTANPIIVPEEVVSRGTAPSEGPVAKHLVNAQTSAQLVVPVPTDKHVGSVAAINPIIARATSCHVVSRASSGY
jgi:hypothetical protein